MTQLQLIPVNPTNETFRFPFYRLRKVSEKPVTQRNKLEQQLKPSPSW